MIRRELCGDRMDLCSIINGRGGRCSENCKFCVQSAHNHTNCEEYGFLDTERFVEGCGHATRQGVNRYSIVTAGAHPGGPGSGKRNCQLSGHARRLPGYDFVCLTRSGEAGGFKKNA